MRRASWQLSSAHALQGDLVAPPVLLVFPQAARLQVLLLLLECQVQ